MEGLNLKTGRPFQAPRRNGKKKNWEGRRTMVKPSRMFRKRKELPWWLSKEKQQGFNRQKTGEYQGSVGGRKRKHNQETSARGEERYRRVPSKVVSTQSRRRREL